MIRIGLFSEDHTLFPLLSSALGKGFQIRKKSIEDNMALVGSDGECDVLILDLNSNSSSLAQRIAFFDGVVTGSVPSIILSDDALRSTASELVRKGAFGYCCRPPSIRDLKTMLSRAYESSSPAKPVWRSPISSDEPLRCDRMIGSSTQMRRIYELVNRVKDVNASVFINGESGTGKELIARAIHNLGSRSSRPFVAVSCGAIPETLIEAELFGHEKGAFTGTVGMREGYFERAGDGTLFLDEIGDLSLFTQVKLLRVLQEMEFSRLGSSRLIPLRARLIFATNRDLPKMVAEGTFRQDLFFRINVMRVAAPPLREHIEDVSQIAGHFLRYYSHMFGKPVFDIEPEALAQLRSYPWPGNVRELENIMQSAVILAAGTIIRKQDLPLVPEESEPVGATDLVDIGDYNPACSFERQLRDYKIRLAIAAVRENDGNKTLAARTLGISRAYVHRLIRLAETDPVFDLDLREIASA